MYYRLRQEARDGTDSFSSVRPLALPARAGFAVEAFPNPLLAAGFLNVFVLPSAPAQVTAWLAATALVLALTCRHLRILFRPA